jgi:Tfp pilus assembly protein PilN
MIEINLLPKDYRKRSFDFSLGKTGIYAIVGAVGVVLMLVAVTFYQSHQLSELDNNIAKAQQRAAMLQKDIQLVDALIEVKGKINVRMQAVESLDRHRSAYVRILEDVARNVPEFIWLAKFGEDKNAEPKPETDKTAEGETKEPVAPVITNTRHMAIEGYAFTLNALAKLMINMMRSDYFDDVELVSTEEKKLEKHEAYNFVLTTNMHFISDEELRQQIAAAVKSAESGSTSHKVLN